KWLSAIRRGVKERIADELLLKIGIRISPRSVRRYMPKMSTRPPDPKQRWMTFVRNHAKTTVASDFFVVVTATFRLIYVFVIMEVASRRILQFNVTQHPSAQWTLQQFSRSASPAMKEIDTSSMIGTAFIQAIWTPP